MDSCIEYLSNHPLVIITLAAVALLMVYFIFVKFFKMVLILGLILLVCGGYFYCQSPDEFPDKVKKTIETVKKKSDTMVEKGKRVVDDSKELTDGIGKVIERGKKAFLGK